MKLTILALVTALSVPAMAVDSSQMGCIYLAGEIPEVTTLTVTPEEGIDSLNLMESATDKKIASVQEQNNTVRGYYVTLKSKNAGKLERESRFGHSGRFNNISYSAKYGGSSVRLRHHPVVIYSSSRWNLRSQQRSADLSISYEGQRAADLLAGKYSDTLTMTISAR